MFIRPFHQVQFSNGIIRIILQRFNKHQLLMIAEHKQTFCESAYISVYVNNNIYFSFQLSLADIALNVYIEGVKAQDSLEKFPKLAENRKKVAALPKIKEYLEKRPKTDF